MTASARSALIRLGYRPRRGDRLIHPGGCVFTVNQIEGNYIHCSWLYEGVYTSAQFSWFAWKYLAPEGWRIERAEAGE